MYVIAELSPQSSLNQSSHSIDNDWLSLLSSAIVKRRGRDADQSRMSCKGPELDRGKRDVQNPR